VQVDVPKKALVLSERAALLQRMLAVLQLGDVVDGVVVRLYDYGAFVSVADKDGKRRGTEVWP
jgi:ribosomal protein S1